MKLNKKIQYGILLTLYISRGGRVSLANVVEGLGLSRYFLYQVASALKAKGVIVSVRGRNGGYELNGSPTVLDVIGALSPINLLTPVQKAKYTYGEPEHRAFSMMVTKMELALKPVVKKSIHSVMAELVDSEMIHMNRKELTGGISQ